MSRMEKKKNDKKRRHQLKGYIFLQIILLVLGLIFTDYALRDMTGFAEGRLIGYEQRSAHYVIALFGSEVSIEKEYVGEKVEYVQSFIDEGIQYMRQRMNNNGD
ncbi:hypothetical protein Amet_3053 [Alkaliphilus metalliredigens QYMF]|uniref:Uncharacterized protein n=1 Tax=Alkaliphilus metalliredigens (strain QYMF) TaxID=293826 RepID=A6TSM5_ALKMQ|nr:hypothetical protein [Alkaliphilus metalliredigens]ABR49193.1 hypothetical protein Amet_3053 [Alkaliphilus metalliredigens QYMF]